MIVLFTPGDHNSTLYNCSKIRAMKRDIECHKDSNASFFITNWFEESSTNYSSTIDIRAKDMGLSNGSIIIRGGFFNTKQKSLLTHYIILWIIYFFF